jgi:uncharacterized membrane protein YgcG
MPGRPDDSRGRALRIAEITPRPLLDRRDANDPTNSRMRFTAWEPASLLNAATPDKNVAASFAIINRGGCGTIAKLDRRATRSRCFFTRVRRKSGGSTGRARSTSRRGIKESAESVGCGG